MTEVTFKGNKMNTSGELPSVGDTAPDFQLTHTDLEDIGLGAFEGKKKVLSITPSLDTSVCSTMAKKFNDAVADLDDVVLLNVSADLPFAAGRVCESMTEVVPLSTFRSSFGRDYGVEIVDGALKGLTCRAVVVLSAENKVLHTELVSEITEEPDYERALEAARSA
ncbi:thiol peroxidase [Kiritimatiella glycovorans]|uniref:Putative thiol peroxidase n=1 Tax=Kiritimatiella glycovorans TaxID=1307763 RepID=A0A0G3EFA6_9BACT|nr:thiol peroxidase [Kiritimatiella glycovorans]AKJ65136.1 putative thiol peroxidase [Kiritimatiella glycovorans]